MLQLLPFLPETLIWELPCLYARREKKIIARERGWCQENSIKTDLVKNNSYLPLVFPFILVTFPQLPLSVQHSLKIFRFCHFFSSLFLMKLPCNVKLILSKFVCSSPVDLLSSNLILRPSLSLTSKEVKIKFLPPLQNLLYLILTSNHWE